MLSSLIGDHSRLHVLAALGVGSARFNAIQRRTGLHAPQVQRALDKLRNDGLVLPKGLPPEGSRRPLAYGLTPKGRRALKVLEDLQASAEQNLGPKIAAEFREVFSAHS